MIHFAIIGAQKAGTTFIERLVGSHPDIYLAWGEDDVFEVDADTRRARLRSYKRLGARYKCVGVKRPVLLYNLQALDAMVNSNEDIVFIVALRDPVARAISAYVHYQRDGFLPMVSVSDGLERLLARGELEGYPRSREILEFGLYGKYLSLHVEKVGLNKVLIVGPSDLTSDGLAQTKSKLSALLQVPVEGFQEATRNPLPGAYSPVRMRYYRFTNRFVYSRDADNTRLHARYRNLARLVAAVDRFLLQPISKSEMPSIEDPLVAKLRDFYEADQEMLGKMGIYVFKAP